MNGDRISVGIAGLGRSGWDIHAALLEPLSDLYQIVAVVDADANRRQDAGDRFACHLYGSYDELVHDDNVELVIVALPSHVHTEATLAALSAGKHVVCEKPMAVSLADADRMLAAAKRADRILTIFQQRRYNPDFVKVKEMMNSGLLGRIVQIRISESKFTRRWDWQTLQKYGGGTLNNTGPHFLDMALQCFGSSQPEVFCSLDRTLTLGDADDHVKIVLKGEGAPNIDIELSSCCAFPGDTWNIMGTLGGLSGSTRQLRWQWFDPKENPARELDLAPTPDRSYNRDALLWHEDSWQFDGSTNTAYEAFYRDLHDTLRKGSPLVITPESVRRVIWLQERCHELSPISQEVF